jgi:uncharacterized protein with FMN-binding domain
MTSSRPRPKQNKGGVRTASTFKARKGKLAGSIVAMSSAAIISIYTLGRANTSAAYDQLTADAPTAAAVAAPSVQAAPGVRAAPTVAPSTTPAQSASSPTAAIYKDGSYTGNGNSRHGGMEVTVVIKDGKIISANVTSCGTRYPCSDINPLIRAAVSKQSVPANHVSGATDSSKAYTQALAGALKQAKA